MMVEEKPKSALLPAKEFIIPLEVRAFLQQYNIPEEHISKLFMIEENKVMPIYRIKTTKKAEGQIQLALLKALENALMTGKFEFSIEDVRGQCKSYKLYDKDNFKRYFKNNS